MILPPRVSFAPCDAHGETLSTGSYLWRALCAVNYRDVIYRGAICNLSGNDAELDGAQGGLSACQLCVTTKKFFLLLQSLALPPHVIKTRRRQRRVMMTVIVRKALDFTLESFMCGTVVRLCVKIEIKNG
jgi:hypothetical protein